MKSWLAVLAVLATLPASAQGPAANPVVPEPTHPLLWLALVTLGIVALLVVWQMFKVRRAKRLNTHSSLSRGNVKTDPTKY